MASLYDQTYVLRVRSTHTHDEGFLQAILGRQDTARPLINALAVEIVFQDTTLAFRINDIDESLSTSSYQMAISLTMSISN